MDELMRQLGEIEAAHGVPLYEKKTQAMLWALKLGTITLDQVVVTEGGWHLLRVTIEEPEENTKPAEESESKTG